MNLLRSAAVSFVRARIDEISAVDSDMFIGAGEVDDRNLEETVARLLPEAIISVHSDAPAALMEGREASKLTLQLVWSISDDGVLDIDFSTLSTKILRLISFRCDDSNVLVSGAVSEDSALAKLQHNKFMRGTPDSPVIVLMADSKEYVPHYKYYTTSLRQDTIEPGDSVFKLVYFPFPTYDTTSGYFIAPKLELAVLNYLTGLVLLTYKQEEYAKVFLTRATDLIK